MSSTADLILERRRTRRRLSFWRFLAIAAVVVAVIAMVPRDVVQTGDHIARISIDGVILDDPQRDAILADLAEREDVDAVIVSISSPGGTVVASEAVYLNLRRIAETKPIVSVMREYAASGGYITAIAADHIVARGNTMTGSIGVLAEIPNFAGLLDTIGIDVTRVKSAPLKAEPSITEAPSPEALAAQEALIADMFAWFRGLVSERRDLDGGALDAVTDGRAFTGRQALALSLVDTLGGERDAVDWLVETHGVDPDLQIVDYWPKPKDRFLAATLDAARLGVMAESLLIDAGIPRLLAIMR